MAKYRAFLGVTILANILVVITSVFGDDFFILNLVITIPLATVAFIFWLNNSVRQQKPVVLSNSTAEVAQKSVHKQWQSRRTFEASIVAVFLHFLLFFFSPEQAVILLVSVMPIFILTMFVFIWLLSKSSGQPYMPMLNRILLGLVYLIYAGFLFTFSIY